MKLMTPGILVCLLCSSILPVSVALQRKTSKPSSLGSSRPRESWEKPEKSLLEVGRAQKLRQAQLVAGQIKAISYNIRWRSGAELDKLIELDQSEVAGREETGAVGSTKNNPDIRRLW